MNADTPPPTVVPLDTDDLLSSLWDDVLAPSFPPEELIGRDELLSARAGGTVSAYGVVRDGRVMAGAVGTWSPATGVLLLEQLAIAPGLRGGGVGGTLLAGAVTRWQRELNPRLVLAEVEHPAHHSAHPEHGDPAARLRFYARLGARALAVPYFQPGIHGPGSARVPALLLLALAAGPPGLDAGSVPAGRLRGFLADHLTACEGTVADDAPTRRLLDSVSGTTVALVDPADGDALAGVPVGLLDGAERYAPSAGPEDPTGSA